MIAVIAAAIIGVGAFALCIIFPNKYADRVNAAADEFGLSRSLVRSVVWAESRFDARATSDKGAVGLMQIMPNTLDECATALGIRDPDGYDIFTNLRCGCYYLSCLIEKFDGDETAAFMAYNAGEANARRFLAGEPVFSETKKYVEDIAKARRIYGFFGD